jgi:hypothetical protein
MKTVCPFCKVEYSVANSGARIFQCAVCGCVWRASAANGKNSKLWIFILSSFVLFLAIFSAIALVRWASRPPGPLVAVMQSVSQSDGVFIVSGIVENKSEKLYGVPNLIVIMKDNRGMELASRNFAPPAPLLDAGESVRFSVSVQNPPAGIKKIAIELEE